MLYMQILFMSYQLYVSLFKILAYSENYTVPVSGAKIALFLHFHWELEILKYYLKYFR